MKDKVPSEIAYVKGEKQWGSRIYVNTPRYIWMKLELEGLMPGEAAIICEELSMLSISSDMMGKRPVDIVADFLTEVKKVLIENLDNHYGRQLWRTLPITLVVTVPAVWTDAAKARTMQAVRQAGFKSEPKLIAPFGAAEFPELKRTITTTEPEAAALYTMSSMKGSTQDNQLSVGDGFIVCDMGGGTVDLISYRVAETEPTSIEEATIGTGDQCGGSFVDRAFIQWLEMKLGDADFQKIAGGSADSLSRTSLPTKLGKMVQQFSLTAKSGFTGSEDFDLDLPAFLGEIQDPERGMFDGELRITAWTAIVRGATAKGLEGDGRTTIKFRKCRRHYGTSCTLPFQPGVHRESDSYMCMYQGHKRADNQMSWIVKKGQQLGTADLSHGKIPIHRNFWTDERRVASLRLLAADCDLAPNRSKHTAVYTVADIVIDLSPVPDSEFKRHYSPSGLPYDRLTYALEISIQSSLEFSFLVNGTSSRETPH
ncbi:hypothetical protein N0V90_007228 [Kalmusia sp. IMI 367209]|nr:hypothetical protein N0V90_007228 [Kalmusia sp. IMI 367209]